LEKAEDRFSSFSSKNSALDIPAQAKAMIEAAGALEGQLIAARTELGGLKQTYTDNNVRVRALQAQVDELERQAEKLNGKSGGAAEPSGQEDSSVYLSIRELPALGVSYADLYRTTKVEEGIFETLTREYELAKVQEAKETPTLKVIDAANVPEIKSFPPRALLIAAGTLLSLLLGIAGIFGSQGWQRIGADDPGKILAVEMFAALAGPLVKALRNGAGQEQPDIGWWARLHARRYAPDGSENNLRGNHR
jgi:capsule polysaccharide export protein KpsE/RkpR